ncbi:hypothetical protein GCM10009804_11370 [Kribbella hippodromi]|uniref:Uncharacterized protein n=2 Tax=Kribbella hippodromi TaxID=434347 RepID=A0ABN2CBW3_9ACTN
MDGRICALWIPVEFLVRARRYALTWPMDEISGSTATLLRTTRRRHLRVAGEPGPRRFLLDRHQDISGVSGTGVVAEGVEWSDGTVALRWLGRHPTTTVWQDGIDALLTVHGHNGATTIRWLDA